MWKLGFADAAGSPGGDEGAHPEAHAHAIRDEVNQVLINVLPWGISFVFHAGLVLLTIFVAWTTVAVTQEEEVIIPVIRLSTTPGAPLEMRQSESRLTQTAASERRAIQRVASTSTQEENPGPLSGKVAVKTQLIGGGAAGTGKPSPFGTAIDAGGGQFKANFFGSGGGNVKRLVIIVDATGSLMAEFPFVLEELKRTVNELSERQQFTIIFFTGDGAKEVPVPRPGMKFADGQTKAEVIKWIDPSAYNVTPGGKGNPVAAVAGIQAALRYKPDLLFLLSDNITGRGRYEINRDRLLDEIKRANTAGTKINTIQFLVEDPLDKLGPNQKGTMKRIAEDSGGEYRFVSETELNIR